jgi:hypothetical protein
MNVLLLKTQVGETLAYLVGTVEREKFDLSNIVLRTMSFKKTPYLPLLFIQTRTGPYNPMCTCYCLLSFHDMKALQAHQHRSWENSSEI